MNTDEIKTEKSYYQVEMEQFIAGLLNETSVFCFADFSISFVIGKNTTNAPLIYAILDRIDEEIRIIEKNRVNIFIDNEKSFIQNAEYISDLLCIIKAWKTLSIKYQNTLINYAQYNYLINYCFEKNNQKPQLRYYSDLSKKYLLSKKRKRSINNSLVKKVLSKQYVEESLIKVIDTYIELYCQNTEVIQHSISNHLIVLEIEKDFVVCFGISPKSWRRGDEEKDWDFPEIMIQELTNNSFFKFNYQGFRRCFLFDRIGMEFFRFHGFHYYNKLIDKFDYVNLHLPQLSLNERVKNYSGETHHFIILKMINVNNATIYGVGYTKKSIHSFVLKLCDELETKNSKSLELNGASCLPYVDNKDFIKAFLSWKGERKRWRLENKFSYYYTDYPVKNDLELLKIPKEILNKAQDGEYDNCEFGSYIKPVNKWKSEELVYNFTKKLYKDYQVIYQYRPYYLTTEKGNMSYDIYICGLKVAIEYQGKQHFEPVEFFGGKENYERQHERDLLKAKLSKENGVDLIYINYWEDITPDLIKNKIEIVLMGR